MKFPAGFIEGKREYLEREAEIAEILGKEIASMISEYMEWDGISEEHIGYSALNGIATEKLKILMKAKNVRKYDDFPDFQKILVLAYLEENLTVEQINLNWEKEEMLYKLLKNDPIMYGVILYRVYDGKNMENIYNMLRMMISKVERYTSIKKMETELSEEKAETIWNAYDEMLSSAMVIACKIAAKNNEKDGILAMEKIIERINGATENVIENPRYIRYFLKTYISITEAARKMLK